MHNFGNRKSISLKWQQGWPSGKSYGKSHKPSMDHHRWLEAKESASRIHQKYTEVGSFVLMHLPFGCGCDMISTVENSVINYDKLWYTTMALRGQIACRFYKGYSMKLNRRAWPIGVGKRWLSTSPHDLQDSSELRCEEWILERDMKHEIIVNRHHGEGMSIINCQCPANCKLFLDFQDENKKTTKRPSKCHGFSANKKSPHHGVFSRRMAASLRLELQDAETQQARLEATSGRQAANAKQQAAELRQRRQVRDGEGWGVEVSVSKSTICPA